MNILIDPRKTFQTFSGFGASGAWWALAVGALPVRDEISRLLYSKTDGIGLTSYRYNIGAGSKESGKGDIGNPLRRTECFETAPGEYDFSRDANAVYMMRQAVKDGAKEITLFVNSPLERLTRSGAAHCDKRLPFLDNLPKKNYRAFAVYCLDVTEHFVNEGLPVRYLSPVNEPFWVWNGGQEGCHYRPRSTKRLMRVFAEEMDKRPDLAGVKLAGLENGDIRWRNHAFTNALLKDPKVRRHTDAVDVHSYFLPVLRFRFLNDRPAFLRRFKKWMDRRYPGVPVRMSEWTHMQGGRDKGMASALVMANVMWEDLTILNVCAWQHWIAVSEVDYCDGLIYINLPEGSIEMTKRYSVTGNFSRYIPVGAVRVRAESDDPDVKPIAFTKDGETVLILINNAGAEKTAVLASGATRFIVTDKDRDLAEMPADGNCLLLPPESVCTVLFENK